MAELTFTLLIAIPLVLILTTALVWVMVRTRAMAEMEDPELARTEEELRAQLDAEANSHDLDGLVINWDEEMKRRGL